MLRSTRMLSRLSVFAGLLASALSPLAASPAYAQATVYYACYVVATGTVYRVREAGLPTDCSPARGRRPADVMFSWTDGANAVRTGDAAGGDLGSTFPNPTVLKLLGRALATTAPTQGQVYSWDAVSSQWVPTTPATGVTAHSALTGLTAPADDHTQYLLANGARVAPDGFAVTGTLYSGALAASGAGDRVVWFPQRGAFRAGFVDADQWDATNIGLYSVALGWNPTASAMGAIAIGSLATASGHPSLALGYGTVASGGNSTAMGSFTTASGEHATATGDHTTASGLYSTAIGRYASTNAQSGALVIGDGSSTSLVMATSANQFIARFAGGYQFNSNAALTSGVVLFPGAGSWSSVSDARKKTAFLPVDGEALLSRLASMPVRTWQYKSQAADIRHIGPTAQDFRAAFGVGESDTTITSVDANGVALAAVKALEARMTVLARHVDELTRENVALRKEVSSLRHHR